MEKEKHNMTRIEEFLNQAFAGESQANRKYIAFATKADQEGYPQAARLFRAAAEAEAVHSANHLKVLKAIKATKENLREAIAGETHEFKEMYPEMIEAAKAEGDKAAERTFTYANEVEKYHAKLYHELMDSLETSKEAYPYFVCPVCGMTTAREPPESCPVCGAKGKTFKKVE
jgi:rubrerythrin